MTSNDLVYPPDIHRDCSFCPLEEQGGGWASSKCDLIGTGIHQPPDVHLMEVHGYSQDKVNGIMLGAKATGYDEMTTLYRVHQFILLFAPAHTSRDARDA